MLSSYHDASHECHQNLLYIDTHSTTAINFQHQNYSCGNEKHCLCSRLPMMPLMSTIISSLQYLFCKWRRLLIPEESIKINHFCDGLNSKAQIITLSTPPPHNYRSKLFSPLLNCIFTNTEKVRFQLRFSFTNQSSGDELKSEWLFDVIWPRCMYLFSEPHNSVPYNLWSPHDRHMSSFTSLSLWAGGCNLGLIVYNIERTSTGYPV